MAERNKNPVPKTDETAAARPAQTPADAPADKDAAASPAIRQTQAPGEIGGPAGPEPTRYGDWEKNGICSDF